MNALILAGGEGRRLRPRTNETPKPLLRVGGVSMLERMVIRLADTGVNNIVVSARYLAEEVEEALEAMRERVYDRCLHLDTIAAYVENEPLGTAGSLRAFDPGDAPVLVVNGDLVTGVDFGAMLALHETKRADLTVGIVRRLFDVPYGIIDVDVVTGRVRGVIEKPSIERWANGGVYVANARCVERARRRGPVDMTDLISEMCDAGEVVMSYHVQEYWQDVGTPEDLAVVEADAREGKI